MLTDALPPAGIRPDPAGPSAAHLLDELENVSRELTRLQTRQVQILAALNDAPPAAALPGCPDKGWIREEVACVLGCSPEFAGHRLREAGLVGRCAGFLDLLAAGEVNAGHVRALSDVLGGLEPDIAEKVAEQVMPRAAGQSVSRFRAALRRALLVVAPRTDEQEREANVADRRVCISPYAPGVSSLWALLPEAEASAIGAAIDRRANASSTADDVRTADQRRADALVDMVLRDTGDTGDADTGSTSDLQPLVQVSVALSTLLGMDDQPADLDGVGPIPASLARRLAADPTGTWRRLVTDDLGRLLDYGRTTYRPPPPLADFVTARDRTCRFPGCGRGARTSEIDHRVAWADGGPTNSDNLQVLCARHHHLKHETRWKVELADGGNTQWTSPAGRRHTADPPAPYPIDTTVAR